MQNGAINIYTILVHYVKENDQLNQSKHEYSRISLDSTRRNPEKVH